MSPCSCSRHHAPAGDDHIHMHCLPKLRQGSERAGYACFHVSPDISYISHHNGSLLTCAVFVLSRKETSTNGRRQTRRLPLHVRSSKPDEHRLNFFLLTAQSGRAGEGSRMGVRCYRRLAVVDRNGLVFLVCLLAPTVVCLAPSSRPPSTLLVPVTLITLPYPPYAYTHDLRVDASSRTQLLPPMSPSYLLPRLILPSHPVVISPSHGLVLYLRSFPPTLASLWYILPLTSLPAHTHQARRHHRAS